MTNGHASFTFFSGLLSTRQTSICRALQAYICRPQACVPQFFGALEEKSNPFSRYPLFRLPFFGEIIWVSVKRQPLFPKTPIRVAFFLRYILVSFQKSNLNSPKCILQLPFPGNALKKALKRATQIPQNAFYGCFFGKCRGVECVRDVDNKSQSASLVNAIIILKALEAVFE